MKKFVLPDVELIALREDYACGKTSLKLAAKKYGVSVPVIFRLVKDVQSSLTRVERIKMGQQRAVAEGRFAGVQRETLEGDIESCVDLYSEGNSTKKIAEIFGVSQNTIYRWISPRVQELKQRARENGWISIPEAVKLLGVSKQAVYQRIQRGMLQCVDVGFGKKYISKVAVLELRGKSGS